MTTVTIDVVDGPVDAELEISGSGDPAYVLFSGADGTDPWHLNEALALGLEAQLALVGTVVDVSWDTSWMEGTSGPKALGLRPKAVLDWVHDNLSTVIRATGHSGGATALAYALSFHSEADTERAVYTGGPTHARLAAGCLGPGAFDDGERSNVDLSYGNTKCFLQDSSGKSDWDADSLDTADGDFAVCPSTFIFGCGDTSEGPNHAMSYVARLRAGGTQVQIIRMRNLTHSIQTSTQGLSQLYESLTS